MRNAILTASIFALCAAVSFAADDAPKTPETPPKIEAPVKTEAPAKPAVAEAPAKTTEAPTAPAPKPLDACAAKEQPVADAFQQAHDAFAAWLRGASDMMAAADQKVDGLKAQIADKEAAITKAKLDSGAPAGIADLRKQDQALWAELKAEQAKKAELCRAFSRAARQKVRELNQSVLDAAAKIEP